jgi:membrane-associated phospholipid phosphatase
MIPWSKISFMGDSVVTLPMAAAIVIWLLTVRETRMAFRWGWLLSGGLTIVAISKIAFIGWGLGISSLDFTGISGHAMRATAVLPVFVYLAMQRSTEPVRIAGAALGLMAGIVIGISRIVLGFHSISEVVAGCLLGSAIGLSYVWIFLPLSKPHLNRWLLACSLFGLFFPTAYAKPAPTERWIDAVALYLSGHDKPYVRGDARLTSPAQRQQPVLLCFE